MENSSLLQPTLHVEVSIRADHRPSLSPQELREDVKQWLITNYKTVEIDHDLSSYGMTSHGHAVNCVEIVDYTGPQTSIDACFDTNAVTLDIQTYTLKPEHETQTRRIIKQSDGVKSHARIIPLPSVLLKDEWNSLIFEDALPSRLLRYLTRMVGIMKQSGLNISAFNWNRLCLLHGPPGSGKSTLCRALAQKLSIRLADSFSKSVLVEINTNGLLSKYFGESGKLINETFENICSMAQDGDMLIVVVMDEVETIAGSRERSAASNECGDGLRATNQLLTRLDRLRAHPNVLVLCTSNLISSIDQAFLDRVDIKQLIPCPSPEAVYNIFRSCLNELVRSNIVTSAAIQTSTPSATPGFSRTSEARRTSISKPLTRSRGATRSSSTPDPWSLITEPEIPTYAEMRVRFSTQPRSPAYRLWVLAQSCHGLSGRTLRRLPVLGLAMFTWGGVVGIDDAVSALEAAVEQELMAQRANQVDLQTAGPGIKMVGSNER